MIKHKECRKIRAENFSASKDSVINTLIFSLYKKKKLWGQKHGHNR